MRFVKVPKAHEKAWAKWVRKLPKKPRKIAERFDPWTLYRMKPNGLRVTFHSIDNDGMLTVVVSGRFNLVLHERRVFGVSPDQLEECDLPGPNEKLGAAMTQEQVMENIDVMRVLIRPDLWTLDADGKAIRKH